MRSFLFVLLAGCAVTPVVVEEESRLLFGGPELTQQEEASLGFESSNTNMVGSIDASPAIDEEDETAPATPSVFMPGKLDIDRPAMPEEEPESVPVLFTEQVGISWYGINGLALSHDGMTGMLGMSGGNSCEYDPDVASLAGADFTNQSCPDIPE